MERYAKSTKRSQKGWKNFLTVFIYLLATSVFLLAGLLILKQDVSAYSTSIMPSKYVRVGMRGYGLSVFHGTRVERFPVVVVGKVKGALSGADLILVRLVGGYPYYHRLGIIAGMSGSPVYINGRLIGAIGYGWMFSQEPLGGVTPIEYMLRELPQNKKGKKYANIKDIPVRESFLDTPLYIGGKEYFRVVVTNNYADASKYKSPSTIVMAPAPVMLEVGGFSPKVVQFIKKKMEPMGLTVVSVPAGRRRRKYTPYLRAGSPLGVTLVDGDLFIGGTGTLTYRKGKTLLAFGHPMLMGGSSNLPLNAAYIEGVVPSSFMPFKLSSSLGIVGTLKEDRFYAISGVLGRTPAMAKAYIEMRDVERNNVRKFNIRVANQKYLTPLLATFSCFEASSVACSNFKDTTAILDYNIKIKGYPEIKFQEYAYGKYLDIEMVRLTYQYFKMLYPQDFDIPPLEKFSIKAKVYPHPKVAKITDVTTQYKRVKPGDNVEITITLQTRDGKTLQKRVKVPVPSDIDKGRIKIAVSGGKTYLKAQKKIQIHPVKPVTYKQCLDLVRKKKRNNDLVISVSYPRKTIVYNGVKINNLPSSKIDMFRTTPHSNTKVVTDGYQTSLSLPYFVEGDGYITLIVSPDIPSSQDTYNKNSQPSEEKINTPKDNTSKSYQKAFLKKLALSGYEGIFVSKNSHLKDKGKKGFHITGSYSGVITSAHDYFMGNFTNTSITNGNITLGHKLKTLYSSAYPFILGMVYDEAKDRIVATESPSGYVLSIQEGKEPVILGKTEETLLPAISKASDGTIYIGTAPNGKIFKLSPDGTFKEFCQLKEEIVWCILPMKDGSILAGTGNAGKVYKISPNGKAEVIFDPPESHITSLAEADGSIFVGCANNGTIYKLEPDGRATPVYKTLEDSVDSMYYKDGILWAASGELLYKITPSGKSKVYIFPEDYVIYVTADADGNILVGTSNLGRIYRINQKGEIENLFESKINQATSIIPLEDGSILLSTGNPGKVIRVKPEYNSKGSYYSEVIDTGKVSKFGRIQWTAYTPEGTSVTLQTRSGNTPSPDNTWSEWSGEYTFNDGQPVMSPCGRYIQIKANLSTTIPFKTPILYEMKLYYAHLNTSPILEVLSPSGGEKWSGKVKIRWKGYVANPQTLSYSLYYSKDFGKTWKPIKENIEAKLQRQKGGKGKSPEESYKWNTKRVEDGIYLIKVKAFDRTEPQNENLTTEVITKPVLITNTEPEITILSWEGTKDQAKIIGFVKTKLANVKEVLYRLPNKGWSIAYPEDGIFDNTREKFVIYLNKPYPKSFRIRIKALDEAGNEAKTSKYIRIHVKKED